MECIVTVLRISGKLRVYISQSPTDTILHPTLWVSETPQGPQVKTTVHPRGNGKEPIGLVGHSASQALVTTGMNTVAPAGPPLPLKAPSFRKAGEVSCHQGMWHVVKGLRLWSGAA